MAAGNFDRVGQGAGVSSGENEFASIRRAPLSSRGPRLRGNVDPDQVIESEYELYKDEVLRAVSGKLAASKIQFSALDLDGFYNQAWHSLYLKLADGEEIDNRRGMLISIAHRRAVDEFRALHPDRRADPDTLETLGTTGDIDALLDDRAQLRQFVQGLRGTLTPRELQAAGLCYVYGYTRPEAAEVVGVRPKRMEKIMDSVSKKITPMVGEIKSGEWCEAQASLMNAYAMGLLDDDTERYSLAVEHLRTCSACRRDVLRKRGIAAAVAPLPFLLVFGKVGAAAGAAGATGAAAAGHSAGSGGFGSGLAFGPIAAAGGAVAVVATVAVIANPFGGNDKKPASTGSGPKASVVATPKPSAPAKAKKAHKAKKAKRKAKRAQKTAAPVTQAPTAAPQATPAPAPAPQAQEPAPSNDGADEFDLK